MGETPHILDWFDQAPPSRLQLNLDGPLGPWHLIAIFNWESKTRKVLFNPADFFLDVKHNYWGRDFWSGKVYELNADPVPLAPIPPHGVALLAIRRSTGSHPQFLGSDLHISQGLEVTSWDPTPGALSFELTRPGKSQGMIDLVLPSEPTRAEVNEKPVFWETLAPGRIRFPVTMNRTARLHISWNVS